MKIIAKQGTEFENVCKEYYEQMMEYKQKAFQLAEKYLGVTPTNSGYRWFLVTHVNFIILFLSFLKKPSSQYGSSR